MLHLRHSSSSYLCTHVQEWIPWHANLSGLTMRPNMLKSALLRLHDCTWKARGMFFLNMKIKSLIRSQKVAKPKVHIFDQIEIQNFEHTVSKHINNNKNRNSIWVHNVGMWPQYIDFFSLWWFPRHVFTVGDGEKEMKVSEIRSMESMLYACYGLSIVTNFLPEEAFFRGLIPLHYVSQVLNRWALQFHHLQVKWLNVHPS